MKNTTLILIAICVVAIVSCKKNDSTTPSTNNNTPTNPYYFKFKFDGTDYNLNANFPQYMPFNANEAGGYQVANTSLFPSAGIRFTWPVNDTVTESDILGLAGKTLYFNDTAIAVEVSYDKDYQSNTWYSVDTADKGYYVKINSVTFLKKDTAFNPLRTYVIKGTCNAILDDYNYHRAPFSGGDFNFVISRQDW